MLIQWNRLRDEWRPNARADRDSREEQRSERGEVPRNGLRELSRFKIQYKIE